MKNILIKKKNLGTVGIYYKYTCNIFTLLFTYTVSLYVILQHNTKHKKMYAAKNEIYLIYIQLYGMEYKIYMRNYGRMVVKFLALSPHSKPVNKKIEGCEFIFLSLHSCSLNQLMYSIMWYFMPCYFIPC